MIRVNKSSTPPRVLSEKGADKTRELCEAYDSDPDSFMSGTAKFEFDSAIYGAESVKNELLKAQHGKCAFCESKFSHIAYGDVEHFRPKSAYRQKEGDDLERPGYYWLAYGWDNLFASCQICNQRFKGNLFPLKVQKNRARSHHKDIGKEKPLLIHLGSEDPENFIQFNKEVIVARNGNARGKATIKTLGLDRLSMDDMRRVKLQLLSLLKRSLEEHRKNFAVNPHSQTLPSLIRDIESTFEESMNDAAEYASMARCFLDGR